MDKQEALVKLAQVKLAINYVLRSRMQKRADAFTHYGKAYQMDPAFDNYWEDPKYQERMTEEYDFPYTVKPEYQYLRNIGQVENGGNIHQVLQESNPSGNDIISADNAISKPITDYMKRYGVAPDNNIPELPELTAKTPLNTPNFWDDLAFRASLPDTHPKYVSPEKVNQYYQNFIKRYNGDRGGYKETTYNPIVSDGAGVRTGNYKFLHGFPFYPIEGIRYSAPEDAGFMNYYQDDNMITDMRHKTRDSKYNGVTNPKPQDPMW